MCINNKIKTTFGLFISLFLLGATPQQTKSGIVSDAQTGEALPYATIRVLGTQLGTISNGNGEFRLNWNL